MKNKPLLTIILLFAQLFTNAQKNFEPYEFPVKPGT